MEIETKILLSEDEYARCKKLLENRNTEFETRTDEYFSRYGSFEEGKKNNEPLIRLAKEDRFVSAKNVFTLKHKSVVNDVECNKEIECNYEFEGVEDPIRSLLLETGYNIIFKKIKKKIGTYFAAESIDKTALHAELEIINDKIFAIEVECTSSDANIPVAKIEEEEKKLLRDFFKLDTSRVDNRSWKVIIEEYEREHDPENIVDKKCNHHECSMWNDSRGHCEAYDNRWNCEFGVY